MHSVPSVETLSMNAILTVRCVVRERALIAHVVHKQPVDDLLFDWFGPNIRNIVPSAYMVRLDLALHDPFSGLVIPEC